MWNTVRRIDSSDANVSKYVFENSTAVAEAVLYKYPTYKKRTVICCSTQSGCPVGCRFCGAGDNFVRSLTAEEIIDQPMRLLKDTGIYAGSIERLQIMFMSMGEPLLNMAAMAPAIRELHRHYPKAALLISTSAPDVRGVYKQVRELSIEVTTVGLQFSVHESTDEKRDALIPFKRKLTLAQIAEEGLRWHEATGRRPFLNYCAHEGNTDDSDVRHVLSLFPTAIWEATVSVVCERDEHVAAANRRQRALAESFMMKLTACGYSVHMFDPAGQDDIGGGCGQLWFVQDWMKQNTDKARPSVGYRLPVVHAPRRAFVDGK